jgi:hypothetical protein
VSAEAGSGRRGLAIDAALLAVALALGLWLHQPGVFTVDESHYLLAAHALASRGSFLVENGYAQVQDPALLFFYTVAPVRLAELGTVATVPPLQAALAAPLLGWLGLRALIVLNLLAFGLTLAAVRRLAARVRPGGGFPLVAVGLFGLASFSLEYALGLWPHALSQALVAWALVALAATDQPGRRGALAAAACGLLAGLAVAVRLQNALLLPALFAAALAWPRPGARRLGLLLLGWLPGVLGLAAVNAARLGTWNPFTYGSAEERTGPLLSALQALAAQPWVLGPLLATAGAGLAGAVWLWRRARRPWVWLALAGAGLLAGLLVPATRQALLRALGAAGFHLLDSSLAPTSLVSVGGHTNALGQALYGGVLKKGLLEATPYLVLALALLLPARARADLPRAALGLLVFSAAGLLLLPFVLSAGGLCYSPRYLLELVPPLCVACLAVAWPAAGGPARLARGAALGGGLLGVLTALPLLASPGRVDAPAGGWLPMLLPLGLALGLLVALGLTRLGPARLRPAAALATLGLFTAGALHAGAVHLLLDVPASLKVRRVAAAMLDEGRGAVPDGATLIVWEGRKDVFSPLKLERDVWIAAAGGAGRARPAVAGWSLGRRPVIVLESGMPPGLLADWSAGLGTRVQERRGLRFVELLPPRDSGGAP